jgi:pimeloyl-ACP methyl ester carboxylesterase
LHRLLAGHGKGAEVAIFTSFDGTHLYYEEKGAGTPVVLLHGLSASTKGNWKDPGIWTVLVDAGKRVIGLDARGHGRSEKPRDASAYENQAMARDVQAFFDHLAVENADLVGYSMGAATAVRFASRDSRVRRLVLGGIGGDPATWGTSEGDVRVQRARRWLSGLEAEDIADVSDPVARGARKLFEARGNDLRAMAALLRGNRHLTRDIDLDSVKAPTLVVCGDKDAPPYQLASALPHAEALVLDGDHEGVVFNPELSKAIAAFVSG